MNTQVICVVLAIFFVALTSAGPMVDDNKGHIDNSVRFMYGYIVM